MDHSKKSRRHDNNKKEFVPHTRSSHVITGSNPKPGHQQHPVETATLKPPPSTTHSHRNGKHSVQVSKKQYENGSNSVRNPASNQESTSANSKAVANEKGFDRISAKPNHISSTNKYGDSMPEKTKYAKHANGGADNNWTSSEKVKKRESIPPDSKQKHEQQNNISKPTGKKSGKIPIRRSASIDVGELTRKKKGKRSKKKGPVDKETLIAHAKSELQRSESGGLDTRSGSISNNRPTSLKLSQRNSAQGFFPTPVPQKRMSRSSKSDLENHISNSRPSHESSGDYVAHDGLVTDKSAILPLKPSVPSISINMYDGDEDRIDTISDLDFPTGEGYRKHGRKFNFPSSPYFRLQPTVIKRLWIRVLGLILYTILAFLVFCPFVVVILVMLPVCFIIKTSFKCCFSCCCRLNQGEECVCCVCGQRLSLTERFWVQNEMQDHNIVQSLVIVEYGLTISQIINLVNTRLVQVTDDKGNKLYPRFSQKIIQTCVNYIWKEDREFFIHNHVFGMPKGIESLEDLQDYISDNASRGMTFEKPLWEVHVLTDFGDLRDTVLLFRMHPSLSDGVSLVRVLYKSFADVDSVTTVPPSLGRESCMERLKSFIYGPLFFLNKFTFSKNDFNLIHGKHVHLSGKKVITWSEPFSLTKATRIKDVTRSTLGEVLMSVAAGSIRNYFILNGISHPYDIQSNIPVYHSASSCPAGVSNNVIMLRVSLPTNTEGVVPRLWQMKDCMLRLRESSVFSFTKRLYDLSHSLLAESCWSSMWAGFLRKCSCIVSSLPGPEINLRLSSRQVKTIFYWFPPMQHVALAISFFTYGDQLQMAVSADRAVLPNPELIAKDFIFQMESLYELLAHRRIPGEHTSRKVDLAMLNNEIRPEESVEQIQRKMAAVHQEIQNLKHKLDAMKFGEADVSLKIMKKIEGLKEQFRELLVEVRQRRAAEAEHAIVFSEDDSTEDDDEFELPRRPFRRRAMSVSSRLSTTSVSSTVRPLTANQTSALTPDYSPDSPLLSHLDRNVANQSYSRSPAMRPYSSLRPNRKQAMQQFEILEYQYSPSMERRYKKKH